MTTLVWVLTGIALALDFFAVLTMLTPALRRVPYRALLALGSALATVVSAIDGDTLWASVNAGLTAGWAWLWWKSGGGDGTRRRLRSLRRHFQGVRRTAPSGA